MPQDHCTVRSWGPNVLIRSMSERTRGQQRCSLAIQTNVSSLVDFRCPRNRHSRHRDVRAETWWQAPAHNVQKPEPQWECLANVSCRRNGTCARKNDFLIGYIYLRLFLGSNRRPNKTTDAHRILSQIFTTHIFSCIQYGPIFSLRQDAAWASW